MALGETVIPGPPRLSGKLQEDFFAYIQWLGNFYKALVFEGGIGGISGEVTISGTAFAVDVVFPATTAQLSSANYQVNINPVGYSGTPPANAFTVVQIANKSTTGFTLVIYIAPGTGNSVTFDYSVQKTF